MSKISNDYNLYTLSLEQVVGRLCGLLTYVLTSDYNKESIKMMVNSIFTLLPDHYFELEGGATIEVDSLLKITQKRKVQ